MNHKMPIGSQSGQDQLPRGTDRRNTVPLHKPSLGGLKEPVVGLAMHHELQEIAKGANGRDVTGVDMHDAIQDGRIDVPLRILQRAQF